MATKNKAAISLHHLIPLLLSSPLFQGISPQGLESMLQCLQPAITAYKKSSYITLEGSPFTGLGILLSGEAAVIKEDAAGSRNIMTVLKAGDIFGEMIAFSNKHHWPATVFAQRDCSVIFVQPDKITGKCANTCTSHTQLIKNMLFILSEKALLLNRKVEYLSIGSMRGKIIAYLLEQHKLAQTIFFDLPLNRNDLADFLGVSRTALSREMGRMRDEGLIEFYRSSIKIINIDTLKKLHSS